MKKILTISFLFTTLHLSLFSQCAHDATVTPNNLIMCPDDTAILTTEVYDDYQWFKDGVLIPGATSQTLMVTANNDAGSQFYCATTLALCTENSDTVLVDGWAFLLPFVITHTPPVQTGGSGEAYYCAGTIVELELGLPYDTNITWYESGNPIPGETDNFLYVTQTGYYTCSGAPSLCPDFLQYLGVTIPIIINPPFEPEWLDFPTSGPMFWADDCANCSNCYFYYVDTVSYGGAMVDSGTVFNPGTANTLDDLNYFIEYRAVCYDSLGCEGIDTVYFAMSSIEENPLLQLNLYPNPALDIVQLSLQDDIENYQVRFIDVHGRIVLQQRMNNSIDIKHLHSGMYIVEVFSDKYFIRKRIIKQ